MASIFVWPSDIFLAMYSLVRSSVLSLPMAMMWIAEFACLSPPRLSLRRYVIPDETGTGATPQSMAKDASDPILSGAASDRDHQLRRRLGADALEADQQRGGVGQYRAYRVVELGDSSSRST